LHHPLYTSGVTPAKAGAHPEMPPQPQGARPSTSGWVPASAGMTPSMVLLLGKNPDPSSTLPPCGEGKGAGPTIHTNLSPLSPPPPHHAYSPHLFRAGRPAANSGGRTAGQGKVALSLGSLGGPLRSGEVR